MPCRSALREDPDIILVGELRDLETIRLALTAAETGHLVFGTLHTQLGGKDHRPDHRRVPGGGKGNGAGDAVESLRARDLQTLCKTKDGGGRVAAHEIIVGTPHPQPDPRGQGDRCIRHSTGQNLGIRRSTRSVGTMVKEKLITKEEARAKRPAGRFPLSAPVRRL